MATDSVLTDESATMKEKLAVLTDKQGSTEFGNLSILRLDGIKVSPEGNEIDMSDSEMTEAILSGESKVSDPIILDDNSRIISIGVPIFNENQEVIGGLFASQTVENFSQVLKDLGFSFFVITQTGELVSHVDEATLTENVNALEDESSDSDIYKIYEKMVDGQIGVSQFENAFTNETTIIGYAPINLTSWSVALMIETTEITVPANKISVNLLGIMGVCIFIAGIGGIHTG